MTPPGKEGGNGTSPTLSSMTFVSLHILQRKALKPSKISMITPFAADGFSLAFLKGKWLSLPGQVNRK